LNQRQISSNIERYQTCSILMFRRYICAPPCSTLYGWNLIVTGVS